MCISNFCTFQIVTYAVVSSRLIINNHKTVILSDKINGPQKFMSSFIFLLEDSLVSLVCEVIDYCEAVFSK